MASRANGSASVPLCPHPAYPHYTSGDATKPESDHDFGRNIIPALIDSAPVFSYRFYDENKKAAKYWRDIGTLDAYYEASMDLCQVNPEFNMYDPEWPLRTYQPQAPPAKFVFAEKSRRGEALDSIISPGCIISGSRVEGSVLCPNVRVHSFCDIDQSILMPGVRVGRHARIRRAIIDRDVFIPRGALIGYNEEEDRRRHTVSDSGIVVVGSHGFAYQRVRGIMASEKLFDISEEPQAMRDRYGPTQFGEQVLVANLDLPRGQAAGRSASSERSFEDTVRIGSLRRYVAGDPLRRVAWRASSASWGWRWR